MGKYYIGVDIGGTNIACGIVDEGGGILLKQSFKTEPEKGYNSVVRNIAAAVEKVLEESKVPREEVERIGVGCPGCCNKESGIVEISNNLKWVNVPLVKDLAELTGFDLFIENDANAAAYGEFVAGAAKGANSAVVITLGTGVGSGIIINKKMYSGMNFAGGEIGHTVILADGADCSCGRKGCFEAYCSATGLIRMTKEAMNVEPDSKMHEIAAENEKVSAKTAWEAARLGDSAGKAVVERYIGFLACGITNVINIFQPDIVCIGGGVCNEGDNLLVPLKKLIKEQVFTRNSPDDRNTEIVICSLGNDAGIIGAALCD